MGVDWRAQLCRGVREIWRRLPKFVLGFLLASAIETWAAQGHSYAAFGFVLSTEVFNPFWIRLGRPRAAGHRAAAARSAQLELRLRIGARRRGNLPPS